MKHPKHIIVFIFSVIVISFQLYFEPAGVVQLLAAFIIFFVFIYYTRTSKNKFIIFLRSYLHIPYYGIIFTAFQSFIHKLNPSDYDLLLSKADKALFGFDVTQWLEKIYSPGLTDILTISYFSYYLLPTLSAIIFYFYKRDDSGVIIFKKYIFAIVIAWYSAFIWYILLPAAGPDLVFPQNYTIALTGNLAFVNYYLFTVHNYLLTSDVRNTFPSLHFGIILLTNYFAFKKSKMYFFFVTLPLGTGLTIATLYLRQHYLVDLLGSVIVMLYSIWLVNLWYKRGR